MSSKKVAKQTILMRLIKAPIWFIVQVRDLYVQSLTGASGNISYGNAMGCPTPHISSVPRSFSNSSNMGTTDAELRELINRAASTRAGVKPELFRSKSTPLGGGGKGSEPYVPRSNTVGFGRIDEEKSSYYEDDNIGLLRGSNYPRRRSHAV